ncbi:septin-5 [Lates japonicus]|uniref:Septin-5 n=1 Tax=Lates japonicus TaxID=270547 RepID=A0AAD3MML1_LATJO|nr:septin-5 [Lates japonicus]
MNEFLLDFRLFHPCLVSSLKLPPLSLYSLSAFPSSREITYTCLNRRAGGYGAERNSRALRRNQVHRKSVKKGFDFTLMVAERINQIVEIIKHTVDIEEKGPFKLTIATPGFGDRPTTTSGVHCCLYFIPPFGHGLRPVDVEFMKALHEKVNIIPLIAKADCLTPNEIKKLKDRIREEIDKFGIKVYQFPECDSDEDEEFKQLDKELKECTPFAVIGSNTVVEARGQRVRGRLYPWGIVEVENQSHCDFVKLRNMLIRSHMHDLKDVTCDVHYENYRAQCIQEMTSKLAQDNRMESPIPILPLSTPDVDTEKLIKMKDEELKRMQEMLNKMQQQMHEKDQHAALK